MIETWERYLDHILDTKKTPKFSEICPVGDLRCVGAFYLYRAFHCKTGDMQYLINHILFVVGNSYNYTKIEI